MKFMNMTKATMKQADVLVGKKYMLSLGRRGAVAVTVQSVVHGHQPALFSVLACNGVRHAATARRLSPCPVTDRDGNLLCYAHQL